MKDSIIFPPHGELSFSIEDNLQVITGTGPWNLESIEKSAIDVTEIHEKLYTTKWGVLAIFQGQPVHTPDAADFLVNVVLEDKKHGRVASALILLDEQTREFGKHHITDIYNRSGETFEFFTDEVSARAWLAEKIECV